MLTMKKKKKTRRRRQMGGLGTSAPLPLPHHHHLQARLGALETWPCEEVLGRKQKEFQHLPMLTIVRSCSFC